MSYPIADYITLELPQYSLKQNQRSTFDIKPSQYQSNYKSEYCLMSVADATLHLPLIPTPVAVELMRPLPLNNSSDVVNLCSTSVVSQHAEPGGQIGQHQILHNDVKYLVAARPSSITIRGRDIESGRLDHDIDIIPITKGYITLKFEYLSKEDVKAMDEQTNYTTF